MMERAAEITRVKTSSVESALESTKSASAKTALLETDPEDPARNKASAMEMVKVTNASEMVTIKPTSKAQKKSAKLFIYIGASVLVLGALGLLAYLGGWFELGDRSTNEPGDSTKECPRNGNTFWNIASSTCDEICPDGTYADVSSRRCEVCMNGCAICKSAETCDECTAEKVLVPNKDRCVDECPDGTWNAGAGLCEVCMNDCKICRSAETCEECIAEKLLVPLKDRCVEVCPDGTESDTVSLCEAKTCTRPDLKTMNMKYKENLSPEFNETLRLTVSCRSGYYPEGPKKIDSVNISCKEGVAQNPAATPLAQLVEQPGELVCQECTGISDCESCDSQMEECATCKRKKFHCEGEKCVPPKWNSLEFVSTPHVKFSDVDDTVAKIKCKLLHKPIGEMAVSESLEMDVRVSCEVQGDEAKMVVLDTAGNPVDETKLCEKIVEEGQCLALVVDKFVPEDDEEFQEHLAVKPGRGRLQIKIESDKPVRGPEGYDEESTDLHIESDSTNDAQFWTWAGTKVVFAEGASTIRVSFDQREKGLFGETVKSRSETLDLHDKIKDIRKYQVEVLEKSLWSPSPYGKFYFEIEDVKCNAGEEEEATPVVQQMETADIAETE